eukprot:scaffold1954_cov63-Phaeocystis_antarctica.AAC.9
MPWHVPSPRTRSPPAGAPWPRGTAAQPPRRAPSWRALHRGCSTPWARRASARWPRGRPCLLCVRPAERRTARPQPAALSTRRPYVRPPGLPSPQPRESAAVSPHHPPPAADAPSPLCDTPRAASKRQDSPGS